ncbi:ligase-associated DNA damage response endonuclease PdeM [Paracidovorax wautersii]|uniref:DNA ligase-associated metallophosphoesterase n=1 Tax=Paracidovorax wautersii TaxID=1177982 RepID=A0ABU1IF56_9BURK|nr:ligase-associated DNA damage response endonuclease PdeM [Paracidovorax wautersii]MDR6215586.1 DNA ligase-associated metallophosphoesterase [Paracidovorax wautersii]
MPAPTADALAGSHCITLAGEAVHLLPQHALWWPAQGALFIADLHLGKAATFRARGIPVPAGTTQGNLAQLTALLDGLAAHRLVVLGDFLHAAEAQTPAVLAALAAWRDRHAGVAMTLVRGNHDSHAGDPPSALGIEVVDEPWRLGPFSGCHHPQGDAPQHVLAGHVHPSVVLRGPARDALRLPCFAVHSGFTLLPAFGLFTGTASLSPEPGCQVYAVGGGRVWPVPARG